MFPAGGAGKVSLSGKASRSISLSAVLPALYKIINASGGVDWNRSTTVTLSADNAENHRINWGEFDDAARNKKMLKVYVVNHLNSHDFVITADDIVLYGYTIHVVVSHALDAKAAAKLTAAASEFGKDSSLNFEYKNNSDGTFDLKAKDPVVAAVFIVKPPPGALRAAGASPNVTPIISPQLIMQIEKASRASGKVPVN